MRPPQQNAGGYWASGGDILGRAGPLPPQNANRLFASYGREALQRDRCGDAAAARLCAALALQLARAIVAADDWRCAASGAPRSQSEHSSLRRLVIDSKSARYG
jgi:hypothetical protein